MGSRGGDGVSTARDPQRGEAAEGEKCSITSERPGGFRLSDLNSMYLYCLKCFVNC